MPSVASIAHEKGMQARQAAHALIKDNPEGLSAEQQAEFDQLVQDAAGQFAQRDALSKLDEQSTFDDKRSEVVQDLVGMSTTGEAPSPEEQARAGRNHGEILQRMATSEGLAESVTMNYQNYRNFKHHLQQGGNAREWVEQNLRGFGAANVGGNLVPTFVENRFFDVLENLTGVLNAGCDVVTTMGHNPIELPKMTDVPRPTSGTVDAYTAEGGTATSLALGTETVTLNSYKRFGLTNISPELIYSSAPNIEARIGVQLGRWAADNMNNDFSFGSGNNQPEGVFNDALTSNEVVLTTRNTPTWPELLRVVGGIGNYPGGEMAAWLMKRASFYKLMEVDDGDDRPIFWMNGTQDVTRRLFGDPVVYSTHAGDFDTQNDIVAAYAYWPEAYVVRIVNGVRIERSIEHGFDTDLIYYRVVLHYDGAILNSQLMGWLKEHA